MQGEGGTPLSNLAAAVREFRARDERVDLKEFRAVIDELEGEFSLEARQAQRAGDHLIGGNITAASWIARTCSMSVTSRRPTLRRRTAAVSDQGRCGFELGRDRLSVGLRPLPP